MKKTFSLFGIIWAIFLALFNVIVFVTPNEMDGMTKSVAPSGLAISL